MTQRSDVARGREIIERWCVLAEQRLEYLTELFETGRWRRYHSETAFLDNIQEAKTAVETWRMLLTQEGSPDNAAVDSTRLDRRKALPASKHISLRDEDRPRLPRSLQIVAEPTAPDTLVDLPSEHARSDQAPAADENAWQQGLDLAVMQQRYPLLRNAL
jgi:uncharacterized repeat protein (TIGR03809 family)